MAGGIKRYGHDPELPIAVVGVFSGTVYARFQSKNDADSFARGVTGVSEGDLKVIDTTPTKIPADARFLTWKHPMAFREFAARIETQPKLWRLGSSLEMAESTLEERIGDSEFVVLDVRNLTLGEGVGL